MRRFKFPLQGVLDLRSAEERQAQGKLAQELRALLSLEERRGSRRAQLVADARALAGAAIDRLRAFERSGEGIAAEGARLAVQIDGARGRVEQAKGAVAAAAVRKRVIERLRDDQRAAHAVARQKEEDEELDDTNTMRRLNQGSAVAGSGGRE